MNPYKTDKFKETFTLDQAVDLMNNMNSVRTVRGTSKNEITFGSNKEVETQILKAGFIPSFILRNREPKMDAGVFNQHGFPVYTRVKGFLLDDQGNYLYDSYDEDNEFFDPVLEPILLAVDRDRNEFMFQYPHGICVFGDTTGSLTYVRMD